jgi:hypothetical protein
MYELNTKNLTTSRISIAVALVSFVMLSLQMAMMRILSYTHGHHLAYVVISIALLGFGAAGSILAAVKRFAPAMFENLFIPSILLCALSMALMHLPARPLLASMEVDLLHLEYTQWVRLAGMGLIVFLPFLFGASALTIAFAVHSDSIGRLYAANLAGSAGGALAGLSALIVLLPEQMIPILSLVVLITVFFLHPKPSVIVTCVLTLMIVLFTNVELPRSTYKSISYALQLPEAIHQGPWPNHRGRLEIVSAPALRYAPDLSLRFSGVVPSPPHVFIDGESAGVLLSRDEPGNTILEHTPRVLPFITGSVQDVLILSPDGTALINLALSHNARVTVAEPHSRYVSLLKSVIDNNAVWVIQTDPRLYTGTRYPSRGCDLAVFPDQGRFGGPTGLQTLGEDYLFTVESFQSCFNYLNSAGRIAVTVWLDEPLRHAPRMLDLVAQSLRAAGVQKPSEHVLIVRGWGSLTITAGLEPFSAEDIETAIGFADKNGFDLIWPKNDQKHLNHSGAAVDLDRFMKGIFGTNRDDFIHQTRFNVQAPTDNRPFFYQFLRTGDRGDDLAHLSISERGLVFLKAVLILLSAAVCFLVLGPLFFLKSRNTQRLFSLFYFAGIGAGFMIYEIALIQRFILVLGDPATSAAVVITALLSGMSIGSRFSHRVPQRKIYLAIVPVAVILLPLLLPWMFLVLTPMLISLPFIFRLLISGLLAGLPAIGLGIPFPLGIRHLSQTAPGHIPWACGIDGAMAVLAAPAAAWLALLFGFDRMVFLAVLCYLIAGVSALKQT